jgi:hypothetical protein
MPIRAPLMLGAGGLRKVADGINRAGTASRSGKTAGTFAHLSQTVMDQLGAAGLGSRPTPPSFGRVAGVRFRPPPGTVTRSAGAAGRALAEKAVKWGQGVEGLGKWMAGGLEGKVAEMEGKMAAAGFKGEIIPEREGKIAPAGKKTASEVEGKIAHDKWAPDAVNLGSTGPEAKPVPASEGKTGKFYHEAGRIGSSAHEPKSLPSAEIKIGKFFQEGGEASLDGKGEQPPPLASLNRRVGNVGQMFDRIGSIASAMREAMQQSILQIRG